MKRLVSILLFTCVWLNSQAQVNFVKNPSFENYYKCPTKSNQIVNAKDWNSAIDTVGEPKYAPEYFNVCNSSSVLLGLPSNSYFYQFPHNGNGMAGGQFFYDKTIPPPPSGLPFNTRDYLQGHLIKPLITGKFYCVSIWVNLPEGSGYAHNKTGAFLDNGSINFAVDTPGEEITSVIPQVYTDDIIADTMNWVKIEGSFAATGNETHITIGNFFPNSALTTVVTNYWLSTPQYSYYLIDDVSVIPIDLPVDAGKDSWVEMGKQVEIGRVGDTTAEGLDCKWYHKGVLIDSGAIITVNANAVKNAVDTYVVVQTICGLVKTDTVMVKTAGLNLPLTPSKGGGFSVWPNPSNGAISIQSSSLRGTKQSEAISTKVYDLLGRIVHQQNLSINNKEATLNLNLPSATYILELKDEAGNVKRERIVIE